MIKEVNVLMPTSSYAVKQAKKIFTLFITLCLVTIYSVNAQDKGWKKDRKLAVFFGLSQPLIAKGLNIEGNYIYNRFIFDYSHGVSLDFDRDVVPDYLQKQGVVVHVPFSTGFGVGYRIYEWLNVRVEPKWHRFEFYYAEDDQTPKSRIAVDAKNFSVGIGLYGVINPFKKKSNALKGISIAPSVRFWPTVSSGFEGNSFQYLNRNTQSSEKLKTLAAGIGFTPWLANVSIGYTFDLGKKSK